MIKIEIKSILGSVIFTHEAENNTIKDTVRAMLKKFIADDKTIEGADLSGKDLSQINFSGSRFDNSRFDNSRFDNSRFYNSSFYNSRFYNSRFYNSRFDNSSFYNSSFDNSSFDNSSFDNSSFDNSRFDNSRFYNSSFDNSRFDNSRFDNSSFYNSRFDNSRFYNSRFYNSRFDNSRFDNSRFDNSRFDNSRFYNSRFDNSRFDNSSFYNSRFDDKTILNIRAQGQLSMLDHFKHDFWSILIKAIPEITGLRKSIVEGKIDGSTYEGDCACLVGTIANVKGCFYKKLDGIKPDSKRPAEQWFTQLKPDMTPENSEVAKLTLEWLDEFFDQIKDLMHHRDTTVGLWATDRPDLVNDPNKVLFQIK